MRKLHWVAQGPPLQLATFEVRVHAGLVNNRRVSGTLFPIGHDKKLQVWDHTPARVWGAEEAVFMLFRSLTPSAGSLEVSGQARGVRCVRGAEKGSGTCRPGSTDSVVGSHRWSASGDFQRRKCEEWRLTLKLGMWRGDGRSKGVGGTRRSRVFFPWWYDTPRGGSLNRGVQAGYSILQQETHSVKPRDGGRENTTALLSSFYRCIRRRRFFGV